MTSIVLDLQRDALDQSVPVTQLLRKALVVAHKLGLADFKLWVERELNGYGEGHDIPEYRVATGQVQAWNPVHGWQPVVFHDPKKADLLSRRESGQSIAEFEKLLESKADRLHMPLPTEWQRLVCKGIKYDTEVVLVVPEASLVRVVDSVRTIILNWALKLEEDGVLGEGLSFNDREKRQAAVSGSNVNNFFGPVHNSQIQQGSGVLQVSVTLDVSTEALQGFLDKVTRHLDDLALSPEKRAEAEADIKSVEAQSRSPVPKPTIMRQGLESLGRILEGATGSAAGQLLIELGKILGAG